MANRVLRLIHRFIAGEKADPVIWYRLPADLSTRSIPKPNLPKGPAHKINGNYYYNRDSRRAVLNVTLFSNTKHAAQIAASAPAPAIPAAAAAAAVAPPAASVPAAAAPAAPVYVGHRQQWTVGKTGNI